MNDLCDRRTLLCGAAGGLTMAMSALAPEALAAAAMPWIRRFFHLYTGPDGLTRGEEIPFAAPKAGDTDRLLRRRAERLSLNSMAPNYFIDFHNANQPTLLIPLFGSIIVGLHDGKRITFGHGDIAYAEDCSGKGHTSQAGPEGCFTVQIQLVKALCPTSGSSDFSKFWFEPD